MRVFSKPKLSHKERVLQEIKRNPGITARELAFKTTHKFNARISDLRKDGYLIEARRSTRHPGLVYGYHLTEEAESGDAW